MAQSGFTPIQLYRSATPGAVPLAADLAPGELALNTADEKIFFENASGSVVSISSSGGTLAVANGGTGVTALTANNVILGNGTSPVQFVAPGTSGNVLTSNGTTWTSAAAGASLTGITQSVTPFETSLGFEAGLNTTGASNTFIGYQSGKANTTGANNTAVGRGALDANTTGAGNASLGSNALGSNTTGGTNVAIGQSALTSNTTGSNNTAIGSAALFTNISGDNNLAVGVFALTTATGGTCTAVGNDALRFNSTGAGNTAIGYQAGDSITTGGNNIVIGNTADSSTATVSNEATIGNSSIATFRVPGVGFQFDTTDGLIVPKTITAGGTTGAQTINKTAGTVNFAAAATSLVVTNSFVDANSIIIATVGTNDSTMKSVLAVAGAGSFTLHANAAATAETRVNWFVAN